MKHAAEYLGENVFNESTAKARFPKETFKAVKDTICNGKCPEPTAAEYTAIPDCGELLFDVR